MLARPLLALLVVGLFACNYEVGLDSPQCQAQAEEISVGEWDGENLQALPATMTMHYGAQGGQHLNVDVEVFSRCQQRLEVRVGLFDDAGELIGLGHAPVETEACRVRLDDLRVFLETDDERSGTLEAYVEGEDCRLDAEPLSLTVERPF
jgi:hypothetical protein